MGTEYLERARQILADVDDAECAASRDTRRASRPPARADAAGAGRAHTLAKLLPAFQCATRR
ncbi:hypothetical protein PEC18_00260 [Paucibacter sp. O1-1]|nr:hypothetical protein [Paucibacter sp. O1-1]MDA3824351.1 hypothetical protein [Paucibacter sp. O1-1]